MTAQPGLDYRSEKSRTPELPSAQVINLNRTPYLGMPARNLSPWAYENEELPSSMSPQAHEDSMADPTREETKAEIATAEARTDTKIVRLEGKIELAVATLGSKLDVLRTDVAKSDQYNRDSRWVLFGTIITSLFAIAGLIVTMALYGDALFGRGMNVRDVVQTTIKETLEQAAKRPSP